MAMLQEPVIICAPLSPTKPLPSGEERLRMHNLASPSGNRPSGTVTFLFTDIEGSTTRWEHYPLAMKPAVERHDAILRQAIEESGGHVFRTEGDAFRAVFSSAPNALDAALKAQRAIAA